jgi:hypothetical protein
VEKREGVTEGLGKRASKRRGNVEEHVTESHVAARVPARDKVGGAREERRFKATEDGTESGKASPVGSETHGKHDNTPSNNGGTKPDTSAKLAETKLGLRGVSAIFCPSVISRLPIMLKYRVPQVDMRPDNFNSQEFRG